MMEMEHDREDQAPSQNDQLWNWVDVLLMVVASGLILLLGVALANYLLTDFSLVSGSQAQPSLAFNAGIAALEAIALLGGVYLFGLKRRHYDWAEIGFHGTESIWWWSAVLLAFIFIPLLGLISLLIQMALGQPAQNPQLPFLLPENYSWTGALAMLVFGGIIVPIAEEVLFRGVIYRWLRDRWGVWIGVIVSALVFGALHGEISVAGATFVMGLALAWIFERSQSLWPPILIHILNNSLKLLALYALLASGIQIPGLQ
jgi:membrane protease YdiL (CAAX protease family)